MMSDYKVDMINDGMHEFYVDFHGPSESKLSLPLSYFLIFSASTRYFFAF